MLDPISRVARLGHYADAASGQRGKKARVAESVVLTTEGEAAVREKTNGEDRLLEATRIIIVLGQSFRAVMVDIQSDRVEEVVLDHSFLLHRYHDAMLDPLRWARDVLPHSGGNRAEGTGQLGSGPLVAEAKEELGPRQTLARERLLRSVREVTLV